ncbi:hypothetical protein [Ureibacillus terrenus]|uniref:Uncharacterized protein n=1 Tax=Ureibacillus terrenus TaxID=118246 RepID=A0A540V1G3_9BACL|nr:hypothetical protein [Ureibacillus terrenus]MED3661934.1 hypothetical protein [Ureibacillus terrenus]MED3764800.1 hypothetical protein [Ureibacillus terrenus]TQE90566.1 hypothetical protein FKZ59_08635 [Ureibacillus terrenus]
MKKYQRILFTVFAAMILLLLTACGDGEKDTSANTEETGDGVIHAAIRKRVVESGKRIGN